ncbi:MAG: class I SAM-dependent methyltransferase [Acidimicrobiales bacterium]|nr:class I SAM-dependent methyltransferase [Acidimicrobiales bacterium]
MARRSIAAADIADYATAHSTPPDDVQRALQTATTEIAGPFAGMQIGADQGAFMSVLVSILQPAFAVEVGTFTGYSSLAIAKALPPGGRLLCCDISEEWTDVAREHWAKAGVDDRIDLVIAPAVETLAALPADQQIDFAFIDADKTGYRSYYEEILQRLAPQGVILIDNTLWGAQVLADSGADDDDTEAIRALNDFLVNDDRVEVAQLTVGDGVTMVRRR